MKDHKATLRAISNFIGTQHPEMTQIFLGAHKRHISDRIANHYQNTIAYGPLKGFRFVEESHWSAADRGGMILGLYEQEMLNELRNIPSNYKTFIDLGAADGYYGVGVVVGKLFEKSYCYEITEAGRSVIRKNADRNMVSSQVIVRGEATREIATEIPRDEIDSSVLFVDIEGGEFNLFDSKLFFDFKRSIIFIETHEFFHLDGKEKLKKLISDSQSTHHVKHIRMGGRDLSVFPELYGWNDFDRWILCAEGRPQLMTWLRFDPIT